MSVIRYLLGTFLMFLGFFGVLTGLYLARMKQQDLGKMYMSATMMGGGEMGEAPMIRFLTAIRANDRLRKLSAVGIFLAGALLALLGAFLGHP